jgi:hypothetical protein
MLASVQAYASSNFVYQPPPSAFNARQILVKPNLGYPVAPPVTVSMSVLGEVLRSLRQASPNAQISIVEGVCSAVNLHDIAGKNGLYALLDEGMELIDADTLPLVEYPNLAPTPVRFDRMWAPALLQKVDCRISIGTFGFGLAQKPIRIIPPIEILRPQPQFARTAPSSLGAPDLARYLLLYRASL